MIPAVLHDGDAPPIPAFDHEPARGRGAAAPDIGEPLRGRVYVGLQLLRGRPVGRYVRRLLEWERLPRAEFERLHERRLQGMLAYVRERVPLYRAGGPGLPAPWTLPGKGAPLREWPVLEPDILRARREDLKARPRPRRLVVRRTSGSTGEPLSVLFTPEAEALTWANRYRGMHWHGIAIGSRALRLSMDRHRLRDGLLGHARVAPLDSLEKYEAACRFLTDVRPQLVTGSPSMLFRLARYAQATGAPLPKARVGRVGGEQLFPFQRSLVEAQLVDRVVNAYGCTEVGAIAGECPAGSLHVYAETVHVEILRGDEPVEPGAFGDVVLTSLGNPAMPLVRYRSGDGARLLPGTCPCGRPHPVLADVQARRADSFVAPDGSIRHASELADWLEPFFEDPASGGAVHVQLEQSTPSAWKAVVEVPRMDQLGGEDLAAMERRLAEEVRQGYGSPCTVQVRFTPWMEGEARKDRLHQRAGGAGPEPSDARAHR